MRRLFEAVTRIKYNLRQLRLLDSRESSRACLAWIMVGMSCLKLSMVMSEYVRSLASRVESRAHPRLWTGPSESQVSSTIGDGFSHVTGA